MKVLRNINNNIVLCQDSKGREVIAFGKGIGCVKPPQEIPLSRINRTFYNVKDIGCEALRDIPTKVLNVAIHIIDVASADLNTDFSPTAAITLADHISFAIKRSDQHIFLEMPVQEDIRQLYPGEMRVAHKALSMIKAELGYELPRNEAGTIALHFVSTKQTKVEERTIDTERVTEECLDLIEREFDITIDRDEFNCSRFVTHLGYLLRRQLEKKQISSSNEEMFLSLSETYPKTCACVDKIADLLEHELGIDLSHEERLYLMLHVNRLCSREVSERKS